MLTKSDTRNSKLSISSAENLPDTTPEIDVLRRKVLELETQAAHAPNFSIYKSSPSDQSPPVISPHHLVLQHHPLTGYPASLPVSHDQYAYLFGNNPVLLQSDTISLYDGYCPIVIKIPYKRRASGPLSWVTILRADRALSHLWDDLHSRDRAHHANFFEVAKDANDVEKEFSKKFSEESGLSDMKLYQDQESNMRLESPKCPGGPNAPTPVTASSTPTIQPVHKSVDRIKLKARINSKAKTLGIQFYRGTLDADMELLEKIKLVLPNRKALWLLVDRFFTALYPFMPYLDELLFKSEITRLLGPATTDPTRIGSINVQRRLDFAYLGILLLVLRISYVSLFTNIPRENEKCMYGNVHDTCQFMMNNPINIDVAAVSQDCLNTFNLMKSVNMAVMQLTFFTRLYRLYAPDDGDGSDSGESSVLNSMLLQMAFQLGLNRDPDKYPEVCSDEKLNNLGRKMWYFLLILDMNNSATSGVPLSTSQGDYDTKTPYYKPGNENVRDIAIEKFTVDRLTKFKQTYYQVSGLLRLILNVNSAVPIPLFMEYINSHDIHFRRFFFELRLSFEHHRVLRIEGLDRTLRLKIYFTQFLVHMTLNFHMFRYYEMKQENVCAYFFAKKMVVLLVTDMIPFYLDTIVMNRNQFESPVDFIVTPSFISCAHMGLILLTSLYIRIRLEMFALKTENSDGMIPGPESPKHRRYQLHQTLEEHVLCMMQILRDHLHRISSRYYHAWRITRAQNFLSVIYKSDEFYERILQQNPRVWFKLEDLMLEELATIFHDSIETMKLKHLHNGLFPDNGPSNSSSCSSSASVPKVPQAPDAGNVLHRPIQTSVLPASLDQLPPLLSNFFSGGDRPSEDRSIDNMWVQMMQLRGDSQPPIFDPEDSRNFGPREPDMLNGPFRGGTPPMNGVSTPQPTFTNLQAFSPRSFNLAAFGEDELDMLLMGDLLRVFPHV